MLTISKHNTLKPLGILFRMFANNVCDTKYHKHCKDDYWGVLLLYVV